VITPPQTIYDQCSEQDDSASYNAEPDYPWTNAGIRNPGSARRTNAVSSMSTSALSATAEKLALNYSCGFRAKDRTPTLSSSRSAS
jgi:hypothetical protein